MSSLNPLLRKQYNSNCCLDIRVHWRSPLWLTHAIKSVRTYSVMPSSHRRHGQVSCPCRWCELNWRQVKTLNSCKLETGSRQDKTVLSSRQFCSHLRQWQVFSCLVRVSRMNKVLEWTEQTSGGVRFCTGHNNMMQRRRNYDLLTSTPHITFSLLAEWYARAAERTRHLDKQFTVGHTEIFRYITYAWSTAQLISSSSPEKMH